MGETFELKICNEAVLEEYKLNLAMQKSVLKILQSWKYTTKNLENFTELLDTS